VLDAVRKSITRYNMLAPGTGVAVAVSGGPDSVCLLYALVELAPELGISVAIAHFNHKLRGADSDEDQRFVERFAANLGVPFYSESASGEAYEGNLEQAARRARRRFFLRLIEEGHANRVAVGHTRDDQAETVLFRLMRGSGLTGLAGVLPVTADGVVRPLIGVTRAQVLEFLSARGIPWREDASNQEPRFARNRIRHVLLPQLAREWNPNLSESLAHLADLAFEEERVWRNIVNRLAAEVLERRAGGIEFTCAAVQGLPVALARRLLRRAIAEARGDLRRIEFAHVETVLELAGRAGGAGKRRLPGLIAQKSFGWMRLESASAGAALSETELKVPGAYPIPGDSIIIQLELSVKKSSTHPCGTLKATELSVQKTAAPLVLRGWRPGDQYWPEGDSRSRTLQELFQAARIPSWRRRVWPMISCGDKILWVRHFGAAKEFAPGRDGGLVVTVTEVSVGT
jgi:tRNA(Ile)-lysidine synthase